MVCTLGKTFDFAGYDETALNPLTISRMNSYDIKATLTVFDAAISRLMTSVHSKLVQSRQYALLKTTSQRHCISNWFRPGCHDVDLLVPAGTSTQLD
jgi:hypothetical protein